MNVDRDIYLIRGLFRHILITVVCVS